MVDLSASIGPVICNLRRDTDPLLSARGHRY
jgi:hypothetical protein